MGHQYKLLFSHGTSNSKGVCSMVPKDLLKNITKSLKDKEGWCIALQFHLGGKNYTVINVYAPMQNNVTEQLEYLKKLEQTMEQFENT